MIMWTALLAPLGVISTDGRRLAADVDATAWVCRPGATLLNPERFVIGEVRSVTAVPGDWRPVGSPPGILIAQGVLLGDEPPDERLRPQIELGPATDQEYADGVLTFRGGEVAAVVLGDRPAFPGVWIRFDNLPGQPR